MSLTHSLLLALIAIVLPGITRPAAAMAADIGDNKAAVPRAESRQILRARMTSESTLASKQGRSYRILVSSPEGPEPPGGFPVIYVLDGDAWFGMAVEIARMREYETLAPALIVGIGYPSRFFFDAEGRTRDFTPPNFKSSDPDLEGAKVGGASEFLAFINQTLKPWLRARHRVDSANQILFGHSLGGLFVLYAMFHAPESFTTYLAASPPVLLSEKAVLKDEAQYERATARTGARILITVGGFEPPHRSLNLESDYRRYFTGHPELIPGQTVEEAMLELFSGGNENAHRRDMVGEVRRLSERLVNSGVRAQFVEFADEEHMSAAVSALNRGIPFALRP
jgi:predicted alpha/beta superfamily hydrolase